MNLKNLLKLSVVVLFSTLTACVQPPVLHKENRLLISEKNIESVCHTLTELLPEYSCEEYFDQEYILKEEPEQIDVFLQKERLELRYKTKEKNKELFDRYEQLLDRLKIKN